jgi:hypothetical protein
MTLLINELIVNFCFSGYKSQSRNSNIIIFINVIYVNKKIL